MNSIRWSPWGQTRAAGPAEPPTARDVSGKTLVWISAGLAIFFGFFRFGYFFLGKLAEGDSPRALPILISELTGGGATVVAILLLIPFVRRFPMTRERWSRRGPLYLLAVIVTSAVMTTFQWITRAILFPLSGLDAYDYGILWLRYPMEAFNHVFVFLLIVGGIHLWLVYQEARARELRSAQMEILLAKARLENLHAQLHPHFLFNSLNAVSAVMYRSPEEADRILSRLSDLLRMHLSTPASQLVTVEEEVAGLRLYLEVMEARFPDRLRWSMEVDPEAREAQIPTFLLQPLVENAVKHGISRTAEAGSISVRIHRQGASLLCRVEDDGPGIPGAGEESPPSVVKAKSPKAGGVGLGNTRERLLYLYGRDASLRLLPRHPRGVEARIQIPFRVETEDSLGQEGFLDPGGSPDPEETPAREEEPAKEGTRTPDALGAPASPAVEQAHG